MKNDILGVTPFAMVEVYWRLGRTYYLNFHHEFGGSMSHRMVANLYQTALSSLPRWPEISKYQALNTSW